MEARILTSQQDVIEAKKLAYEVLIKELEWSLRSDNPSGLHIKDIPAGKILCDDYDAVATWFGAFEQNKLVGSLRICKRLNSIFELERYRPLLDFLEKDELACEATRFAVRKPYRRASAVLRLYILTLKFLLDNKGGYLFTTGFWPKPGKLYVNKFGMTRHDEAFRYHPEDPQEVCLYYINGYDRPKLIEIISNFEKFFLGKKTEN